MLAANTNVRSNTIYGVWSPQDGSLFAAAESGTIFYTDPNGTVTNYTLTNTVDFYDIFGFSAKDVWAVGTYGKVYRFDGTTWTDQNNPDDTWLESVWGRSPTDMYFSGAAGTWIHYDGTNWTKLQTNAGNRLYCIGGLPGGPTYAVGSYGTILKYDGTTVTKIYTGMDAHFLGIQLIPGTSKFLICGTNGAMVWLENDEITAFYAGTYGPLYGLDAASENEIVVVGWQGNSLYYDGTEWHSIYLGANCFLEGVVYLGSGSGNFGAGGWFGRIVEFGWSSKTWKTLQNGRAESIKSIALNTDGSVCGVTDIGNILAGSAGGAIKQLFTPPIDLNISIPTGSGQFVVGGNDGYLATLDTATDAITVIDTGTYKDFKCASPQASSAYIAGSYGSLYSLSGGTLSEVSGFSTLFGDDTIYGIAAISSTYFYARTSTGDVYAVDLTQKTKTPSSPNADGLDLLFGSLGYVFGVKGTVLYKGGSDGSWSQVADVSSNLAGPDETVVSGSFSTDGKNVFLGGSQGTVISVSGDGTMLSGPSGAYQAVTAVSGYSTNWAAGVTWARIQIGSYGTQGYLSESISGPTYFGACPYTGNDFLYCGEAGNIGTLDPTSGTTTAIASAHSLDWLDAKPIAADTVCTCGVAQIGLYKSGTSPVFWYAGLYTFTTLLIDNGIAYFGTTKGEVLTADASAITGGTFQVSDLKSIAQNLGSTVVSLNPGGTGIQVTLQNGSVFTIPSGGSATLDFVFNEQTLTHPTTTVQPADGLYLCGDSNFLCLVNPPNLSLYDLPGSIYQLTMHGSVGLGDYWVGGYSGTLYLTYKEAWYTVNTGIGNQLYSVGANSDYLIIGATFGGLRYDNSQFIKTAIGQTSNEKLSPPEPSCDVARKDFG